ncbi:MAG: phosphoribosylformylglycinamidine synthase, partial [Firmicutes bacterium]|nr:phosphoribosylformylglycinamidine synthase [Bacillota bacterium]
MIYRVFVEKKEDLALEANALFDDAKNLLGIKELKKIRIINRYDAENISGEIFEKAKKTVFSEPQTDVVFDKLMLDAKSFAVEYLPGQFDQRADSAEQCIQIMARGERPKIKTAKVYLLYGDISDSDVNAIKKYVINPVEAREASFDMPKTLETVYEIPKTVQRLDGFTALSKPELAKFIEEYSLAMDIDDILFCQKYFLSEKKDPTITEIKMIDTYWSDHCRHTTFLTTIDSVKFSDEMLEDAYKKYLSVKAYLGRENKPITLMDIATVAARYLKKEGKLDKLDDSEEINACTVKIEIEADGKKEDWLLLFKNETHNHPTEIEPFGGAATCIGGAIRDPLSGRAYVYGAMRVTGAANPKKPISETLKGKLPQRKIVATAAAGYSSYGNQIGLATGIVDEIYHEGYAAKRMEIGAVIAAAPKDNVVRETPIAGDVVILIGGDTGRDGLGGATGSSKSHTQSSLETCGAEVQKGNAPEERKLQRFFRNKKVSRMIKRCNDFGAGGVSVAIGELADGLKINLDAVPKKYEGLDGTELAISESQERMAVVIKKEDTKEFISLAKEENLKATLVAEVTDEKRLVMNWNGNEIVNVSREFLNSNGAEKHIDIIAPLGEPFDKEITGTFAENYLKIASDLNICSKRGLSERFDSTIGAGTVLMPFGGKYQLTPIQAMVHKIPQETKETHDCSLMAYGFNPFITEKNQYCGAYLAVVESVCKLIATGAEFSDVYLTFQEYFERLGKDKNRWGKPLAALLGAFSAQIDLGIASIGGKDSMSGTFDNLDVPPTLVSFAVTTDKIQNITSPEFKKAGNKVVLISPKYEKNGLPEKDSLIRVFDKVHKLLRSKKAVSCYTLGMGGIAEAVMKMCMGNGFGFEFESDVTLQDIFGYKYASFLLEIEGETDEKIIGRITEEKALSYNTEKIDFDKICGLYENNLESIYKCNIKGGNIPVKNFSYEDTSKIVPSIKTASPKFLIPVFPGTNCEYDTKRAITEAGGDAEIFVINNLTKESISKSVEEFANKIKQSQVIFIPGGFSGGDEPDGSGKFISAFFRNDEVKAEVNNLLKNRDGLMCGICNGFQALIKLGLVPFGEIVDIEEDYPTLTFNTILRHQSKIVRTRVASTKSAWLKNTKVGEVYNVPISHGEGRFLA